jgi:hypothetical protein
VVASGQGRAQKILFANFVSDFRFFRIGNFLSDFAANRSLDRFDHPVT